MHPGLNKMIPAHKRVSSPNQSTDLHYEINYMKQTKQRIIQLALAMAVIAAALVGCEKKGDAISTAEQADKRAGVAAPGIEETKAIAEEGFIYGLPIVMNYAVMNEFCVDKNSSQYKGPFNQISNEARVFTYKDTAVVTPNSDTPYSM